MDISLNMSKTLLVYLVLVVKLLLCGGLSSAAREKKAKCPTCKDIVEAFKKVNNFSFGSVSNYHIFNQMDGKKSFYYRRAKSVFLVTILSYILH